VSMAKKLRELSRAVSAAGDDVPAATLENGEKALAAADEPLALEAPRVQQVPLDVQPDVDDIVDAEIVEPVQAPRVPPMPDPRPMPNTEELR
jgi:hypothetical protein